MAVTELPTVLQLDHLQTHVAQATFNVQQLLSLDLQISENGDETHSLLQLPLFISHMRELEAENEHLRAEVKRFQALREENEAQTLGNSTTETRQGETAHATNVHFEQASIHAFYAGTGVAIHGKDVQREEPGPSSVSVMPVEEAPALPLTGEALLNALPYSQRKPFRTLLSQVKGLSPTEKMLFLWLIENDEKKFSSQNLADAVNKDIFVTWCF